MVVADPDARQPDDLFFTSDLDLAPEEVASLYAGRWSIEDTFRNTKQLLGGEAPQSWKGQGPERAAALSLWTYSAVWLWYVVCCGAQAPWQPRPWHRAAGWGSRTEEPAEQACPLGPVRRPPTAA